MELSAKPPVTPSRSPSNISSSLLATPNTGSGSSLSALTKFHVSKVRELVWRDVLSFQEGSFKRFLHRQLSLVEAINSLNGSNGRAPMDQIDKELSHCLKRIVDIMNAPENSIDMNTIRTRMQNYCLEPYEKDRYNHFVAAANTALCMLATVKIGNSKDRLNQGSDDFVLFMVHDPREMKSQHKNVEYHRKPDVVMAFRKHIQALYPKSKSKDLLEAVQTAPGKKRSLPWKQALLCVEKELAREEINKIMSETYSVTELSEGGFRDKDTIERELKKKSEESGQGDEGKTPGKRPAEDDSSIGSAAKKSKDSDGKAVPGLQGVVEIKAPSKAAQVADYAAEAMYNCFGRSHIINLLVKDTTVNVWYFDHECPIQMTAFDFIDDLPYFFLFLFTLQRFTLADWGYISDIVNINEGKAINIVSDAPSSKPVSFTFTASKGASLYPKFGLNGRATGVLVGNVTFKNGDKRDVAVKLSYQEKSRTREHEFVNEARKRCKGKEYEDVCDYLPEFLVSRVYNDFDSDIIRNAVLVTPKKPEDPRIKAARVPCLIVMPKYMPIASLTTNWEEFLNAFLALIYCHAMLWSVGIEHGDISEANLMWDPKIKKPKLCDYDLSHFTEQKRPTGFSNTGTWAFMALELLTKVAMQGEEPRFYRHDLESFFAVLIWILFRYCDGKLLSNPPLEEWNQPRYTDCADERLATYKKLRPYSARNGVSKEVWKACVDAVLAYKLEQGRAVNHQEHMDQIMNELKDSEPNSTPPPEDLKKFEFLKSVYFLGPVLSYNLFKLGEGPNFAKKLRKYLPNLPPKSLLP